MGSLTETLPYWQINVPPHLRTETCPAFLQNLNAKDLCIISTPDALFTRDTWPEVRQIIATNRIDLFQRVPSNLRRYLENNWNLKKQYGSVLNFVLTHRLQWEAPVVPKGKGLFEDEGDWKVLWNDWPYGIDERIVHLVVWTKFELRDDPVTGELEEGVKGEIEGFVEGTFCGRGGVGRDQVIWFKNWASLKSIHSVEHFHVMLYGPDPEFVREVTKGDRPLGRREVEEIRAAADGE
ncbi:hypothetical protein GE09DRAFT_1212482 [Coniochaeta sp. 2T2.1]|nr:hypothetical protein GE09DRAFT_1212482 [Coniochaeta sp. 2T2.1]